MKGTVYIVFYSWRCGGVETRSYRFYKNLLAMGIKAKIFSVIATENIPNNVLQFEDVNFITRKKFLEFLKETKITKEDVLFLFRPGSANDVSFFNKYGKEKLPFYFEHFDYFKKARKIVYIYGNAETQPMPFYKEVIERMDYVASGFLVDRDRKNFVVIDYNTSKPSFFKKPIWWFNISYSPKEKIFLEKTLRDIGSLNKEDKSVIFTGRVTPEKNVVRVLRSFLALKKKNFDCRIYGVESFSREKWYAEQKFGFDKIKGFFFGNYNGVLEGKKILRPFNFGINLRKKNLERYHILEQTTLEYIIYGVVPLISENFSLENEKEIPFHSLIYKQDDEKDGEDAITEKILSVSTNGKLLDKYRKENLQHIRKYNDGEDVIKSFLNFMKNF